jgi:sugar/nucleoside kinase (ribokinase family)
MILLDLAREEVDLSLVVQEPNETTAVSVILLSGQGGNSIVTFRGASRQLTSSDIPFDKLGMILKPGGWIHLTSVAGDMELVEKVLAWGKEKGRKIYWNPGAAELRRISEIRNHKSYLNVDALQLNRQEASEFFGVNFTDDKVWKAEHCSAPAETILIITDGERGGRICYQGKCSWYQGVKTQMVDSTGAGDAFGSGFVAALMSGKRIEEAIEWGRKQAASVVEHIGAKEGLLNNMLIR